MHRGHLKITRCARVLPKTAKTLWLIYVLLTVACALALWFASMPAFDAIRHSFATIISAGSLPTVMPAWATLIVQRSNTFIIFLPISGCNYGLHFSLLSGRSLKVYWRDRSSVCLLASSSRWWSSVRWVLWFHDVYNSALTTLNEAFFGGVDGDNRRFYHRQHCALAAVPPVLLLCSAFIGGYWQGRRAVA